PKIHNQRWVSSRWKTGSVLGGNQQHVILSGHLHTFLVEPFVTRRGAGQTLQIHCGSSTSTRHRGNPNDLAILDITGSDVAISRQTFDPSQGFTEQANYAFAVTPSGWQVKTRL
ncbi:MAG: hypothetical protein ACLGIP_19070, partial [Alphaproteobacteria bacterium]